MWHCGSRGAAVGPTLPVTGSIVVTAGVGLGVGAEERQAETEGGGEQQGEAEEAPAATPSGVLVAIANGEEDQPHEDRGPFR